VADEKIDPKPFWDSLLPFDKNGDNKIERKEMTGHFTFPLRPELPLGHPGYGIPLPKDEKEREKRRDGFLNWVDKNRDGFWTREEFEANLSSRNSRPILAAIRPGGKGDITSTHVAWRVKSSIPEVPSPVFHDKRIYLVRNGGLFSAVDTDKGKMLYRERLGGSGYYSASPIVANGHVYTVSDQGVVSVLKEGDEFQVVHELELGEMTFVSPAVDRDTIYFRTEKHLMAYRKKK
jgi:outer membrane protein assembly factor BamB